MAQNTRNTKMAIVLESVEGTPVAPSTGTDYVALQDGGFALAPDTELLPSAEIRGSIGAAKPILGNENPSFSLDHYLKHSGVEGTAPEYNLILRSLFGSEATRVTERDTAAGSTAGTSSVRAVINVGAGEGAEFARGHFLLIKDATNGYSIRPVYSVATDALSLGFNLSSAPAAGVNLGRDTRFSPSNSGHPSLSVWDYRGDGGAIQMISGLQITEGTFTGSAGELVNVSFSGVGTGFYYDPIVITSTTNKLDFDDGGGEENAVITAKVYKDPIELASEIESKMNALTTDTITVSYSSVTGKYTIATDGATLSLLWNTGANTAQTIGTKIGFLVAADDTGALTYTSDNAITLSAPQTPSYDVSAPIVAKDHVVFLGSFTETSCVEEGVQSVEVTVGTEKFKPGDLCAESGRGAASANARTATVSLVLTMSQYDAIKYKNYRSGDSISFMWHFGTKVAGNWEAGKSGAIWFPDMVLTAFSLDDADGIVTMNLEGTAHVDTSGNGEVYLGFV